MTTKRCEYCSRDLPLLAFTTRSASKDGLSYKCRECASAYAKAAYKDDPQKAIERAARWAASNRDSRRAIVSRWDDANRERKKVSGRERARLARASGDPRILVAGRVAAQARRHRQAAAGQAPSASVVKRILDFSRGQCLYCLGLFTTLTIDHFEPLSRGGSGQWWNLVPCCKSCNSSKKDRDGPSWVEKKFGRQRLVELVWRLETLSAARLP